MGELTYTFISWVESYNLRKINQHTWRLENEQLGHNFTKQICHLHQS